MAANIQELDLPDAATMASVARDIGLELIKRDQIGRGVPLTLAGGLGGLSILYSSLISVDDDAGTFRQEARRCLHEFQARLPQLTSTKCGLYNGLAGMAWAIQYSATRLAEPEFVDQDLSDLFEVIEDFLNLDEPLEYDLIGGIVGIGMFALTLQSGWRERLIKKVLERLEASAISVEHGVAWQTPSFRNAKPADPTHAQSPEFNLGIAHGVPGVVNFLAQCSLREVGGEHARGLLQLATEWLCRQALRSPGQSCFGYVAGSSTPSRAAWCYGDPGIAVALVNASSALGSSAINDHALSVVRRSAARNMVDSGVVDTGYCHGTAGLAHLLRFLYERTGVTEARHAYQYWLAQTVRLRQPGEGICGYRQWVVEPEHSLFADFDYLTGVIGIALVFLDEACGPSDWAYPFIGFRSRR